MAKLNVINPLTVSLFLGGMLMFAVVGIVRSVTTPSQVGAMTEQGYSRINVANNLAGAVELPPYQPASLPSYADQRPAIVGVYDNAPQTLYNVTVTEEWNPLTDGRRTAMGGGATFDSPGHTPLNYDTPVAWQDDTPNPTWLTTKRDPNGWVWVWGGAWFPCQHINVESLAYAAYSRNDPALSVWADLAPRDQSDVAALCKKGWGG